MTWQPMSLADLHALLCHELAQCSDEERQFFARVSIEPAKWGLAPRGNEGGGFWAVAVHQDRVLWWNDLEDGFNVSRFDVLGQIPRGEYWCNQDELRCALPRLRGDIGPSEHVANA